MRRPILNRLAGLAVVLAALAAAWFPFWFALLMIAVGAQGPDKDVPDGDPCCGHPDSWSESAEYVGTGALAGVTAAGLLALAAAGTVALVEGRAPRWIRGRRARRLAAVWTVATLAAAGLLLASG